MLSIVALLFVATIHTASSQYYLQQHNSARRQVGVSNLRRSYGLEQSAQKVANYLCTLPTLQHSRKGYCNNCRPYGTGENCGGHGNIEASVTMMIAEKKDWTGGANGRCTGRGPCGHYAQIISSNTNYVGCAVKKCRGNGMAGRVVCHYSADARFEADEPENAGEGALSTEAATQTRNLTIGIVVGIAVLVIAGALVGFFCWRKKKAAASAKAVQVLDEEDASDDEEVEVAMTQDMDDGEEEETIAVPLSTN